MSYSLFGGYWTGFTEGYFNVLELAEVLNTFYGGNRHVEEGISEIHWIYENGGVVYDSYSMGIQPYHGEIPRLIDSFCTLYSLYFQCRHTYDLPELAQCIERVRNRVDCFHPVLYSCNIQCLGLMLECIAKDENVLAVMCTVWNAANAAEGDRSRWTVKKLQNDMISNLCIMENEGFDSDEEFRSYEVEFRSRKGFRRR